MQYLAILGRQPKISLAELESLFSNVTLIKNTESPVASFDAEKQPVISRLGGTIKLAHKISTPKDNGIISNLPIDFLNHYTKSTTFSGKLVIGISDYSKKTSARAVQGEALHIKRLLKKRGVSIRVLPNKEAILSSAAVFHNQLGEKAGHFEFLKCNRTWYVGIGVQNIKAYAERDQARPARDAKNGMLPPKLAQILINLCGPLRSKARVLDPFCGTGVVLQEALLLGYRAYGTDKSERIVNFAEKNLKWIFEKQLSSLKNPDDTPKTPSQNAYFTLSVGDATNFKWLQPIDAVAFEGYLGPPMSQIPAAIKIKSVKTDLIPLYYHTLQNLSSQLRSETPVVMAIPAFLRPNGTYERLNILDEVEDLGYNVVKYKNLSQEDLLYHRDGQVVAREIIVLRKK